MSVQQLMLPPLPLTPTLLAVAKGLAYGMLASSAAVVYSEILYQGTKAMYVRGKLLRYYPLPQDRHVFVAWCSALSFCAPVGIWAAVMQPGLERSWNFNIFNLLGHLALYMVMHDAWFYLVHTTFHKSRPLYEYFHAMHHECIYSLNIYLCGYAEAAENFIQVGMPWVAWTVIAGSNVWNWILPYSFVLFTTLLGHSGYRSSPKLLVFHPLILPVVLVAGKKLLTPGDHQVHHTYRRFNFGLFFNILDKYNGTYKKPDIRAYDVYHWTKWAQMKDQNDEQSKKWMGKHITSFAETEWGF